MKKLFAILLAITSTLAVAHDNWTSSSGSVWKNGTGLCWRNANWTPATAAAECDGAVAAPVAKVADNSTKPHVIQLTLQGNAHFDFDKSVLKPAGKVALDKLVDNMKNMNMEVVVVVGHTDSIGSEAYNLKLGQRRANTVKAYLISKSVPANRIYTESKGESKPVADNATPEGRAKNRRVEVEVVGTTAK